jgi:hypothetical protein
MKSELMSQSTQKMANENKSGGAEANDFSSNSWPADTKKSQQMKSAELGTFRQHYVPSE